MAIPYSNLELTNQISTNLDSQNSSLDFMKTKISCNLSQIKLKY